LYTTLHKTGAGVIVGNRCLSWRFPQPVLLYRVNYKTTGIGFSAWKSALAKSGQSFLRKRCKQTWVNL